MTQWLVFSGLSSSPGRTNKMLWSYIVDKGKWLGRPVNIKKQTKRLRFELESPWPYKSVVIFSSLTRLL